MPCLERGLIQVYTGDGKGKTTAAVGQAVRARGAGCAVLFVQFLKGGAESSELGVLRNLGIKVIRPATMPTGTLRNGVTDADRNAAYMAWVAAASAIASGEWDVIVLDELHGALKHELVDLDAVLAALRDKPAHVEVITTGRRAPEALKELADLVSEVTMVKHPLQAGIAARRGIEF